MFKEFITKPAYEKLRKDYNLLYMEPDSPDGADGYSAEQLHLLKLCTSINVDTDSLNNPRLSAEQMRFIMIGLEEGLDVSKYADICFNEEQMLEILLGLREGLDVSLYADYRYSAKIMRQLKWGIKHNADLRDMLDYTERYSDAQIVEIVLGMELGLDISKYSNPDFLPEQMALIRTGLINGLDVDLYANLNLSLDQMTVIRRCLDEMSLYKDSPYYYTFYENLVDAVNDCAPVTYLINLYSIITESLALPF